MPSDFLYSILRFGFTSSTAYSPARFKHLVPSSCPARLFKSLLQFSRQYILLFAWLHLINYDSCCSFCYWYFAFRVGLHMYLDKEISFPLITCFFRKVAFRIANQFWLILKHIQNAFCGRNHITLLVESASIMYPRWSPDKAMVSPDKLYCIFQWIISTSVSSLLLLEHNRDQWECLGTSKRKKVVNTSGGKISALRNPL